MKTVDRGNRVDLGERLGRVVGVRGGEADGQRDTGAGDVQVVLGTRFAAIRGVRPGLFAPVLARTLTLPRLARL